MPNNLRCLSKYPRRIQELLFSFSYPPIPYLKNTTPEWSNRGKMRNEFIPAVHRQFGEDSDNKILYMAESLASYKKLLDKKITFYNYI